MGLRISLFVVAALLLGAQFLRAGNLALVALFTLLAGLLLNSRSIRERYSGKRELHG